jgi:hypothetical protein
MPPEVSEVAFVQTPEQQPAGLQLRLRVRVHIAPIQRLLLVSAVDRSA